MRQFVLLTIHIMRAIVTASLIDKYTPIQVIG